MFDNGVIWHWRADTGLISQLEVHERAATLERCGWAP
jgi:hypothetical protein